MNKFDCEHLIAMGRHIPTPFYVSVAEESSEKAIKIEKILRIVPGKRLIGLSNWQNQSVIVKLFFGPGRWRRNLLSDLRGINLLKQRHIPTPDIVHQTNMVDGCGAVLLIDYLEQGKNLNLLIEETNNCAEKLSIIKMAVATIAKCHRTGLWQDDIHLDNFMLVGESLYLLDGGDISAVDNDIDLQIALDNLALFFAQFSVSMDRHIPQLLEYYWEHNDSLPQIETTSMTSRVISQRKKRLSQYERKLFRSTTANRSVHTANKFVVYNRNIHSEELKQFIADPDTYINKNNLLKAGNASTVASITLASKPYVLKRYNLKSLWHSIKYLFKPSRAHHSWLNASVLEMLGVATPHPYLFYEERIFRIFRRRAFFLSENLDAPTLLEQMQSKREQSFPIERLVLEFKYLFDTMCTYRISHGDMKASNFIFDSDRLYVLDLDAMKRHVNEEVFLRAIKKDLTRFMKNWQGTVFESKFKKLIDDLEFNP